MHLTALHCSQPKSNIQLLVINKSNNNTQNIIIILIIIFIERKTKAFAVTLATLYSKSDSRIDRKSVV